MSDERRPWWYSGDEEPAEPSAEPTPESTDARTDAPSSPGLDWTALISGAQRMVDWATTTVMAPHAEHGDPADHPDCVVCRTLVLVADRQGSGPTAEPTPVTPIEWIPIRD